MVKEDAKAFLTQVLNSNTSWTKKPKNPHKKTHFFFLKKISHFFKYTKEAVFKSINLYLHLASVHWVFSCLLN